MMVGEGSCEGCKVEREKSEASAKREPSAIGELVKKNLLSFLYLKKGMKSEASAKREPSAMSGLVTKCTCTGAGSHSR